MEWETVREGNLPIERHAGLAELLRAAYPHFPGFFAGSRSWSYVRPELRVVGRSTRDDAHAGVLRRFVEIEGRDHLVGIAGLVAVRPELQRSGTGLELMKTVAAALHSLGVAHGLLMCAPRHVPFYERAGWRRLSPRRVRYSPDDTADPRPVVDEVSTTTLVLPVAAEEWPEGTIHWHGASV